MDASTQPPSPPRCPVSLPPPSPTPSTSTTPTRPPRSLERLTIHSSRSTPSLRPSTYTSPDSASIPSPTSPTPSLSPETPTTPSLSSPTSRSASRKSTPSVRRKPVPVEDLVADGVVVFNPRTRSVDAFNGGDHLTSSETPATPTIQPRFIVQPPQYVLPVDPAPAQLLPTDQVTENPDLSLAPPDYVPASSHTQQGQHVPSSRRDIHADTCIFNRSETSSLDQLPTYAKDTQTEPKTLARQLWKWGFLFPALWFIGMLILWIPLRPTEEELDPEKAQKLEEMIVIIRQAELKYARRCAIAFGSFISILLCIIVLIVVVTHFV